MASLDLLHVWDINASSAVKAYQVPTKCLRGCLCVCVLVCMCVRACMRARARTHTRNRGSERSSPCREREQVLLRNGEGLALVLALARPMVVLAEELVALAVDPLLLAVGLERAERGPGLDVVRVLVGAAPGLVVVRRHGREVVRGTRAGVQAPSLAEPLVGIVRVGVAVVGRAAEARSGRRRGREEARREGAPTGHLSTPGAVGSKRRGQQEAPWAARSVYVGV